MGSEHLPPEGFFGRVSENIQIVFFDPGRFMQQSKHYQRIQDAILAPGRSYDAMFLKPGRVYRRHVLEGQDEFIDAMFLKPGRSYAPRSHWVPGRSYAPRSD